MSMYVCTLSFLALIHLINSTCGDLAKSAEKLDVGFTIQRER